MRRRVALRLIVITGLNLAIGAEVLAEFIPGHVFVTAAPWKFCADAENTGADRIYDVDPVTGEVRIFAETPVDDCKWLNGLAFTPDGRHLRAGSLVTGTILEFDSDGNWEVVLGHEDGIFAPYGGNCIAYDKDGNFYVADTGSATLVQFPVAEGGAGVVLADFNDGIRERMSIAFAADGDLYLTPGGNGPIFESQQFVLRIADPEWEVSLFDGGYPPFFTSTARALSADSAGYLYAQFGSGYYRYRMGHPESRELFVNTGVGSGWTANAFSLDETHLYFVAYSDDIGKHLRELDLRDGSHRMITTFTGSYMFGMAVAPILDRALGDVDADGDVDLEDIERFNSCRTEAGVWTNPGCGLCDIDRDIDVDLADFARMQLEFAASNSAPVAGPSLPLQSTGGGKRTAAKH